ncbi:hypothetical protein WJX77_008218 [Trebouxia sp. C0004]
MYTTNPTEGERFSLRLLLSHVAGATSFEGVRMYDGTTYDTFREAANAGGPLADDDKWNKCVQVSPPGYRQLLFSPWET